jgi:hypothetical protein
MPNYSIVRSNLRVGIEAVNRDASLILGEANQGK